MTEGSTEIIKAHSGEGHLFSGDNTVGLTIPQHWGILGRMEVEEAAGNSHEEFVEHWKLIAKGKVIILPSLLDSRAHHGF